MDTISFDRKNINNCLQQRFILPTYQRDYKWEPKQLQELLNDLQDSFLSNHKEGHGRLEVAGYSNYFLGTIITTPNSDGSKTIIDGQQRIITLILILIYFYRFKSKNKELGISDFSALIKREVYGEIKYNISFEESRKRLFDILMNTELEEDEIEKQFESIQMIDEGTKKIYKTFGSIENFLYPHITSRLLPNFIDYITEKILLFEIGVPSEQDAHKVFVTMNDRGLKLGPIDLLKGYLLSNILDDEVNKECHKKWVESINKLKSLGQDEDASFFKTWLRSKYAESVRGKNRGDAPGDFEIIGDSYHRWVIENKSKLGLETTEDFQELLSNIIPKYVEIYIKLKQAESEFKSNFPHVYYNGCRGLTLQSMAIISAIKYSDSSVDIDKKIRGISCYLDYFASVRIFSNKDNTYDNVRDSIFNVVRCIRDKSVSDIKDELLNLSSTISEKVDEIKKIDFKVIKRKELLHILARIAEFLENNTEQTNSVGFPVYIDRERATRTFDIEHILTSNIDIAKQDMGGGYDFVSDREFQGLRNNIGGLILLPRGRNRSLKDKPFSEKISVYATENILAQTLNRSFYQNNPLWNKFSENIGLMSTDIDNFNKQSIELRQSFYFEIAKNIWNSNNISTVMTT
jgi:uncharacterized protein with ParB-like and HNH nuclease domain